LYPNLILNSVYVQIVQIVAFISPTVKHDHTALMQYQRGIFSGRGRVPLELLSLPIERLQIEAPEPDDIGTILVVFAAEEVHHVIEDDGGMRVDIAEGVIVQEVSDAPRPPLARYVVSINRALLAKVLLGLLLRHATIDVKR
jgi:hypothetical protein